MLRKTANFAADIKGISVKRLVLEIWVDQTGMNNMIPESKSEVVRSRPRWVEDAENYVRELKVKSWRQKIKDEEK